MIFTIMFVVRQMRAINMHWLLKGVSRQQLHILTVVADLAGFLSSQPSPIISHDSTESIKTPGAGCFCRFANPASLNGATSWVFLNSPDNIQHVCANNVKNYNRRYLPVGHTHQHACQHHIYTGVLLLEVTGEAQSLNLQHKMPFRTDYSGAQAACCQGSHCKAACPLLHSPSIQDMQQLNQPLPALPKLWNAGHLQICHT